MMFYLCYGYMLCKIVSIKSESSTMGFESILYSCQISRMVLQDEYDIFDWSFILQNISTAMCCYNAVQYNMILHTSLKERIMNMNLSLNPQKTPHNSPSQVSYGVSFVNILEKFRLRYNGSELCLFITAHVESAATAICVWILHIFCMIVLDILCPEQNSHVADEMAEICPVVMWPHRAESTNVEARIFPEKCCCC